MIKVELDNIIFSLQKAGGASVLWQQHIQRLIKDPDFSSYFLEYDTAKGNFFRQQLSIKETEITLKSSSLLKLKRYLNIKSDDNQEKHIFHSSHYRVKKGKNVINVTTVHDFTYENFINGFVQKVHSWQKNNAILESDGIICVSESTKKDLLKYLPQVDENKIRVIYNGVDTAFKVLDFEIKAKSICAFENYAYAIYIGDRSTIYKNFVMAVDACALAKIPLLIIGGGKLTETEKFDLNLRLGENNYKLLLNVSAHDLNYYYNKAYCLLYPSLYEGFGIPVVEAQLAGCPVIATNSSSIPEVIGNTQLAIKNPTAEKIHQIIKKIPLNSHLRNESIAMGLEMAKKFSWDNTYKQTIAFYKELYFEK